MAIDRWTAQENPIHRHRGMLLSRKTEWNNAICRTWMELEIIWSRKQTNITEVHHSTKRDECVLSCSVMSNSWWPMDCSPPCSPVHGILQARILEQVAISYTERGSREFGFRRYTLQYIKEMNNKDLLYITGNYIQYWDRTTEKNTEEHEIPGTRKTTV